MLIRRWEPFGVARFLRPLSVRICISICMVVAGTRRRFSRGPLRPTPRVAPRDGLSRGRDDFVCSGNRFVGVRIVSTRDVDE